MHKAKIKNLISNVCGSQINIMHIKHSLSEIETLTFTGESIEKEKAELKTKLKDYKQNELWSIVKLIFALDNSINTIDAEKIAKEIIREIT